MYDVSVVRCDDYSDGEVTRALDEALAQVGGLSWVTEGMKIVIKANLVTFMKPDSAATTHPALLCRLVDMLTERGAEVVVGDSPGGLYNAAFVERVYAATGMRAVVAHGGKLNDDYGQKTADFPEAVVAKKFVYTSYLDNCDAIIDFCKLKSHGMMGMSAAAKNMFGAIPGTVKPEYHFKYPDADDFADMIVDLNCYFKPRLCICDAVVGMEGNGPTQGKPRHIGAVMASCSPHMLDLACAAVICAKPSDIPTLCSAMKRGLIPDSIDKLDVYGDIEQFAVRDFDRITVRHSLSFSGRSPFAKLRGAVLSKCLSSKPGLSKNECVGCNECGRICPAHAITMVKGKAFIDREKCIKCFCCQEFCPKGAMKVKRPWIAKLLNK